LILRIWMFLDLDLLGIGFSDKFDRFRIQGFSDAWIFGFFQGFGIKRDSSLGRWILVFLWI